MADGESPPLSARRCSAAAVNGLCARRGGRFKRSAATAGASAGRAGGGQVPPAGPGGAGAGRGDGGIGRRREGDACVCYWGLRAVGAGSGLGPGLVSGSALGSAAAALAPDVVCGLGWPPPSRDKHPGAPSGVAPSPGGFTQQAVGSVVHRGTSLSSEVIYCGVR